MSRTFNILSLFVLFWVLWLPQQSFSQTAPIKVNASDFKGMVHLDSLLEWAVDSSGEKRIVQAQKLPFSKFPGSYQSDRDFHFWFRFSIFNDSPDSLQALLCFANFTHADMFFEKEQGGWERLEAGAWTNYSERSFPENTYCHPVKLAGAQQRDYYLQLSDYFHTDTVRPEICLLTLEQEKEKRLETTLNIGGYQLFTGIFFGTLALLFFFSLVQFSLNQNRAYLYYAGYVVSLLLFYLRTLSIEPPPLILGELKGYHGNFEAPLGYLIYIFYLLFIRAFLDLLHEHPILDKFMQASIAVFAALLVVDVLVLQTVWEWRMSLEVHYFTKIPFFIMAFWVAAFLVLQLRSRLANYILTGTFLLLLPTLFTVWADRTPGVYQDIWSHTARLFTPNRWGFPVFMYDVKIGLLLEMFCFLLGLTWKIRQENERIRQMVMLLAIDNSSRPIVEMADPPVLEEEKTIVPEQETLVPEGTTIVPAQETHAPEEKPILQEVKTIILANLSDEDFNVEKLAKKMTMSRTKLFRKLQSEHIKASELIESMRLQQAKLLLETTTMTLSQVAGEVGYKSAGQLSRAYKRVFEVSPRGQNGGV